MLLIDRLAVLLDQQIQSPEFFHYRLRLGEVSGPDRLLQLGFLLFGEAQLSFIAYAGVSCFFIEIAHIERASRFPQLLERQLFLVFARGEPRALFFAKAESLTDKLYFIGQPLLAFTGKLFPLRIGHAGDVDDAFGFPSVCKTRLRVIRRFLIASSRK